MINPINEIIKNENKFEEISKQLFDSVDTNKNGKIDLNELEILMNKLAEEMGCDYPSKEDVIEQMNDLDSDNSGDISFDEFQILIQQIFQLLKEN